MVFTVLSVLSYMLLVPGTDMGAKARLCRPPEHTPRKKTLQEDSIDEVDSTEEEDETAHLDEELFDKFYMTNLCGWSGDEFQEDIKMTLPAP